LCVCVSKSNWWVNDTASTSCIGFCLGTLCSCMGLSQPASRSVPQMSKVVHCIGNRVPFGTQAGTPWTFEPAKSRCPQAYYYYVHIIPSLRHFKQQQQQHRKLWVK
jgi:hypothetical protein